MTLDRRQILAWSSAARATPAAAATPDPIGRMIVINALGGLVDPNHDEPRRAAVTPRILKDARDSGMTAVNWTIGYVAGPQEPFQHSVAEIGQYDALIRAATLNGARAAGQADDTGSIQAGKLANLIVTAKDPTADIANLKTLQFTVKRGREYRRADFKPLTKAEMEDAQ